MHLHVLPVGTLVRPHRQVGRVPGAYGLRHLTRHEVELSQVRLQRDLHVQQRYVQPPPLASDPAAIQCRCNAERRRVAANHVANGKPHEHRRLAGVARHAHPAAHGLHDTIEPRSLPVWPLLAERRQGAGDDGRVDRLERLVVQPQPIQHGRPEGVENHVGHRDEPVADLPALRSPQVDGYALLVTVEVQIVGALTTQEVRPDAPRHVPRARLLDLDNLRAQVAQRPRCHRPGDSLRHLQNADAL